MGWIGVGGEGGKGEEGKELPKRLMTIPNATHDRNDSESRWDQAV